MQGKINVRKERMNAFTTRMHDYYSDYRYYFKNANVLGPPTKNRFDETKRRMEE